MKKNAKINFVSLEVLPWDDIDDEKDEEDSFALLVVANVCWISPPPLVPVEKDIPLEVF